MAIDVPLDGEGFLVNREDWSEAIARELAAADAFEMTEQVYVRRKWRRPTHPQIRQGSQGLQKGPVRHFQERPHEAHLQVGRTTQAYGLYLALRKLRTADSRLTTRSTSGSGVRTGWVAGPFDT